jgi:hypothetical protein
VDALAQLAMTIVAPKTPNRSFIGGPVLLFALQRVTQGYPVRPVLHDAEAKVRDVQAALLLVRDKRLRASDEKKSHDTAPHSKFLAAGLD